jgi:hypothetical protein
MNNLKIFAFRFVLFGLILTACSPKISDKITWQSIPVIIDGQASEYPGKLYYSSKTKMTYSLSNDKANLYLCFKITDEIMQLKIINAGMEIWLDTTSKAKEQFGILFPCASSNKMNMDGTRPSINTEGQKPDVSKMKQDFFLCQTVMQLKGFKYTTKGVRPLEDVSGIKVKINWDSFNIMIYEAVIPFKTFYKESLSAFDSTKTFALTINVNAIQMPNMPRGGGPGGEGMPGGGGGMPEGGGMFGGGGEPGGGGIHRNPSDDNGMRNTSVMFEKSTFNKKFRLEIKDQ